MIRKTGKSAANPKKAIPKTAQQSIPIEILHKDGIFQNGNIFSKTWRFSDINYKVASDAEQEEMFLAHGAILNALPTDATAKITVYNRQIENNIFKKMDAPVSNKKYKIYILELEELLSDKMAQSNNIVHDKYIT
ncbi:MAG: TraE family protein, partial [Clostridia bacterium]|nr:TraE family protein [Clostridia bacterium]